jgi:hypothetical protein
MDVSEERGAFFRVEELARQETSVKKLASIFVESDNSVNYIYVCT